MDRMQQYGNQALRRRQFVSESKRAVFVLALLCWTISADASSNIRARVLYTGTYGNGEAFIAVDQPIDEPGCPSTRIEIPSDHPQLKNWLSIVMAAFAGNFDFQFTTSGCFQGFPTLSQASNSWFHLKRD